METSFGHQQRGLEEWQCLGRRVREVAKLFKKRAGKVKRLLDLGGGRGLISKYLLESLPIEEIFVVDSNPALLSEAQQFGFQILPLDIEQEDLPYEDGYFDAVFCGELIEHLKNPDHLLDEMKRVLAPHGCLILTTPNLASWFNRLALLIGLQPLNTDVSVMYSPGQPNFLYPHLQPGAGHISNFTYRALKELLILHCFTSIERVWKPTIDVSEITKVATLPAGIRKYIVLMFHAANQLLCYLPGMSENLIIACSKGEE